MFDIATLTTEFYTLEKDISDLHVQFDKLDKQKDSIQKSINMFHMLKENSKNPLGYFIFQKHDTANSFSLVWISFREYNYHENHDIMLYCNGTKIARYNGNNYVKSGKKMYNSLDKFINAGHVSKEYMDEFINKLNENEIYKKMELINTVNNTIAKQKLYIQYYKNKCYITNKIFTQIFDICVYKDLEKTITSMVK